MDLPKVLIIGQPFNKNSGGAITQTNLFSNLGKKKLAVISFGHMLKNLNLEVCDNYFQLGNKEYEWKFPFNLVQRKYSSGPLNFNNTTQKETDKIIHSNGARNKIFKNYFFPFLKNSGLLYRISKINLTNQLLNWIKSYNPDVIYAQPSSREMVLFCSEITKKIKKPLIIHMMDDWPSTICDKGIFKNYWQKKIDTEFRNLLKNSSALLSISESMSDEYLKRYNHVFLPFHNPVDIRIWQKYQKTNYSLSDTPTILYAGRIGPGVLKSLKTVALSVQLVNQDLKTQLKFIIKTNTYPEWAKEFSCLEVQELEEHNKMPKIFGGSDFLILPFDFTLDSIRFTKFSMPTKASEFMISGTPIIVFAPKETALADYAKKYRVAEVITENNTQNLAEGIKRLLLDKERRSKYGETAKKIAAEKFGVQSVTEEFYKILNSASLNNTDSAI